MMAALLFKFTVDGKDLGMAHKSKGEDWNRIGGL